MWILILLVTNIALAFPNEDSNETDGDHSRKILGSSVVTSVSVIMDTGNGTKAIFTDSLGKPLDKPTGSSELASPIDLLNPDRYEFYTFDDDGNLVRRLMSLEEIRGIIATGDSDGLEFDSLSSQNYIPENRVNDVLSNVQGVLKGEIELHKKKGESKPVFDTPDVSDSWSMILPAVFGNSGADIKPEKPLQHVTPDTIVVETSTDYFVSSGSTTKSVTAPVESSTSPQGSMVSEQEYATSERLPSSSPKEDMGVPITEASAITEGNEGVTKAEGNSSPSITSTTGQELSSTEASHIPVSSTPMQNITATTSDSPQTTNTEAEPNMVQQERITTSQPVSKPLSSDLASTEEYSTSSHTNIPLTSSTEQASSMVEVSSTNLPLVRSTERTSTPIEEERPSFSTNVPNSSTDQSIVKSTEEGSTSAVTEGSSSIPTSNISLNTSTERSPAITEAPPTEKEPSVSTYSHVSSTNLPLVMSTERTSTTTEASSTERTLPSTSTNMNIFPTNLPLVKSTEQTKVTGESSTEGKSPNLSSPPHLLSSSITNLHSELTSMATKQDTSSSTTERTEESATTTERRMISNSTKINEDVVATTSYDTAKEQVATSETIMISTTHSESNTEIVDQPDNRFETTERYLVTTGVDEATTDKDLMDSIQELLSQTLQNVDEIVMDLNKTDMASDIVTTTFSTNENDADITTATMSPSSSSGNLVSSEATTEPSIYQIISSSNISPSQKLTGSEIIIDKHNTSSSNDSPIMKITISSTEHGEINPDKLAGVGEVPSKNTKTDKTSELNTTAIQSELGKVPKDDDPFTEAVPTEAITLLLDKLSTDMLSTTESSSEEPSTETLIEPSIEIIIKESENATKHQPLKTTAATTVPDRGTERPSLKDTDKTDSNWTLVPTVKPHAEPTLNSQPPSYPELIQPPQPIDLEPRPLQGSGLEDSTSSLDQDIRQYAQLCNELAFGFWKAVTAGLSPARSIFVSPFGVTSLLAMIFLGARGSTSGEMNEMLRLDDMVTFNPHLVFRNVSESIGLEKTGSGVAASAMVRELFSDRQKGMLLPFYKERAKAFYDGFVEEINFGEVGDIIRRRTNLQVKKYSDGKIGEFLKDSFITARAPLAGISVNVFETDCTSTSTEGRDGEMHFVVLPSIRQRRLVPVPAVVYRSGFLAGYDPSLDATAVSLGTGDRVVSTVLVIPGQQGAPAPGDGLARLERSLVEGAFKTGAWSRLLRSLIPRTGLEVQIPRVIHKSVINATMALKKLGFNELFDEHKADLRGMNGIQKELYMSDILQINTFTTCGELRNADSHHSEIYPANVISRRLEKSLEENYLEDTRFTDLDPLFANNETPLPLRPRQARVPEIPRLRFDRPFLYFIRHNPTGLILHIGRFNPRLLP